MPSPRHSNPTLAGSGAAKDHLQDRNPEWKCIQCRSCVSIYRNCAFRWKTFRDRPAGITFCVDWLYRVVRSADINIGQRSYGCTEFASTTSHLTFSDQISALSQSCYYQIRELFVLTLTSKLPVPSPLLYRSF